MFRERSVQHVFLGGRPVTSHRHPTSPVEWKERPASEHNSKCKRLGTKRMKKRRRRSARGNRVAHWKAKSNYRKVRTKTAFSEL
ncbi:hypothetical protein E2C01_016055 [Portunus trituberculatus]|uniref:Uncharacterized protein n=1 Tax=Portunus trituberculatus TaxID=210409 RepID=A0A5B7DNF9_PORTR|nr:hypothetical protein [Portunus trituberculatus]